MVKPRIGSALKVVDAQIAASRESSTESWVSVEMAAVALRGSVGVGPSQKTQSSKTTQMAEEGWQLTHHCW